MNKVTKVISYQLSGIRRILSNKRGYTLVELLASTSIVVIVSGLILGILYSTLRGGNKTKVSNEVSQNGNYALSIIANTALTAQNVTKVGSTEIQDCAIERKGSSIEFIDSNGTTVEFSCDDTTSSLLSVSNGVTNHLLDINSVKINPTIQTCSFSCIQDSGNPYSQPVININFLVFQRKGSSLFENTASGRFNTSVTMRNYSPR